MMNLNKFSSYFVANWKLNGDFNFIDQFLDQLKIPNNESKCVVICPTSIHLNYISGKKKGLYLGAQNVSQHTQGAFTGEISIQSLCDLQVDFCIVGHSERRKIYFETDLDVNQKTHQLIDSKVIPIVCIGETLEEKENKKTTAILAKQLDKSIPAISNSNNTLIAYEPVWAIGTGLTPTLEEIQHTHEFIKNYHTKFNNYKILYGGSVKASNAKEIVSLSNVDGALIGGASLKYDEFEKIIED